MKKTGWELFFHDVDVFSLYDGDVHNENTYFLFEL